MGTKINLDYQVDDSQFDTKVNTNITTGTSELSVVNTDAGGDTMAGTLTCPKVSFGNAIAPGDTASIYGVQDGANTELNIRFGNDAADKLQIEYYNGASASVIVEMDGNLDVTYNVRDYLVNSTNDVTFDLATDFLVDADSSITLDSPDIITVGALDHTGTATFSSNTTINGWLSIAGTTKAAGTFYAGTDDPASTNRLNYDGYLYTTRVYSDTIIVADELNMQSKNITNLLDPTADQHAATKKYVDVAAAVVEEVVVEDTVALGEPVGMLGDEYTNLDVRVLLSAPEVAYQVSSAYYTGACCGEDNVFIVCGRGASSHAYMRCGQYIHATKSITWHNAAELVYTPGAIVTRCHPVHLGNNYFMIVIYSVDSDQDCHAKVGHFTGSGWAWDTGLSGSLIENSQKLIVAPEPFASWYHTIQEAAGPIALLAYANVTDHLTIAGLVWNGTSDPPSLAFSKQVNANESDVNNHSLVVIDDINAVLFYRYNNNNYQAITVRGIVAGAPEWINLNTGSTDLFQGESSSLGYRISDDGNIAVGHAQSEDPVTVSRYTNGAGMGIISRNGFAPGQASYSRTLELMPMMCMTGNNEFIAVYSKESINHEIIYRAMEFDPIRRLISSPQATFQNPVVSDGDERDYISINRMTEQFSLVCIPNTTDTQIEIQVLGTPRHVGFATEAITGGQAGDVQFRGILSGLSGLVQGSEYYLDRLNKSIKLGGSPKYIGRAIKTTKLLLEK